jgi:hypothetical protein
MLICDRKYGKRSTLGKEQPDQVAIKKGGRPGEDGRRIT